MDLLLAEHVIVVAKESAAAIGHADDFPAYTALLGVNEFDLDALFGRAFGATAATEFSRLWDWQNGLLVLYGIDVASHDDDKANSTIAALTSTFAAQFGQMVEASSGIPAKAIQDLVYQQLLLDKAFIDDFAAQKYVAFYSDLDKAYAHTSQLGDVLARRAVDRFPDRFPGNLSAQGVEARVTLNLSMQEHSYLATMATDAAAAKRDAEKSAAVSALATSAKQLDQTWADWDLAVVGYAAGTTSQPASFADRLVSNSRASRTAVQYYVQATVKVIDDQKAKASKTVADDDRAAATAMQPIADSIS